MKSSIIIIAITTVLLIIGGLYVSNLADKQNESANLDTITNNLNKR